MDQDKFYVLVNNELATIGVAAELMAEDPDTIRKISDRLYDEIKKSPIVSKNQVLSRDSLASKQTLEACWEYFQEQIKSGQEDIAQEEAQLRGEVSIDSRDTIEDIKKSIQRGKDFIAKLTSLKEKATLAEIVEAFMDMSWDFPSFVGWLQDARMPDNEKVTLIGIATQRHNEWDT